MELHIQVRNVEVPETTREFIGKKLQRIQRRLRMPLEAHIVISQESTRSQRHRMVVEATLNCNGTVLRGEERASTVQSATDALADTLDRRVMQFKGKLYRSEAARKHGQASSIREIETATQEVPEAEEEAVALGLVVRTKRFGMKPMDVEEAAIEMELLGHAFFFFLNSATNAYNVLYRRQDGDYGLIEPSDSVDAAGGP